MTLRPMQAGNRREYQAAGVLQHEGFFVRSGVPLRIASAGIDVTDVDVFGLKFDNLLQASKVVADCRDRVKSRPHERILWVKGLASFLEIQDAYVVLPKAQRELFQFARAGGVRILTHEMLEQSHTKAFGADGDGWGLANSQFYEGFHKAIYPTYRGDERARLLLSQSRSLLLARDAFVSLNVSMDALGESAARLRDLLDRPERPEFGLWLHVVADYVSLTAVLILLIAGSTWGLNPRARERLILSRLTFGDVSPKKAQEIVNLATQLAGLARNPVDVAAPMPFDLGEMEPPGYAPEVVGLVSRALETPDAYKTLPQFMDFLLFESAIRRVPASRERLEQCLGSDGVQERFKVARNILAFVRDACRVPLQAFWPKEDGNVPRL